MEPRIRFSDHDHPSITSLCAKLTLGKATPLQQVESIFQYVRDGIKFGFTPVWDMVKASETLTYGVGYCNTKATLFAALCRAAGIPARVHFSLIDLGIMRGIMPGFAFPFLPKLGSHSWSEVQLDGEWRPVDSYINDKPFYERATKQLKQSRLPIGYSVSFREGKSSCEFNFGEQGFAHMGAVREDHGVWEDAAQYYATDKYVRSNSLQAFAYPLLAVMSNNTVKRIRNSPL